MNAVYIRYPYKMSIKEQHLEQPNNNHNDKKIENAVID